MAHENHQHHAAHDCDLRAGTRRRHRGSIGGANAEESISISTTSRQAEQNVAPFLHKHIPNQYNPLGDQSQPRQEEKNTSTKYCYRHRPDLKCRRQANEPSMDQLQNELGTLPPSDQQGITHVWSLFSAAPAKHRHLMLQGILAQCCFPQLSYISSSVRELIKIDFLSALPPELGYKILCYLDTTSLCKAAQVSQRWRALADDDVVWHRMCEQHIDRKCTKCGWGLPLLERKRLRIEKRQIQLRATGMGLNQWSPRITPLRELPPVSGEPLSRESSAGPPNLSVKATRKRPSTPALPSPEASQKRLCIESKRDEERGSYFEPRVRPWKEVYKDRFKVGTNWKYGRCSIKSVKGHSNGVMCLQFDDRIMATGSYDATVKIWDIDTGEVQRNLVGHTSGIRCLQFDDSKLISGSLDGTLKMWNWRTGDCLRTLPHNGGVIGLHFDGNVLASGSKDNTIRVWNFDTKEVFTLRGHDDWANAVRVDTASRTVISASDDCTVRLWDLDTRECLRKFKGHVGQVQQVLYMPAEFEFDEAEADADLAVDTDHDEDASSTTSVRRRQDPSALSGQALSPSDTESPSSLFSPSTNRLSPPRYMLTGALDTTIRLWDVYSGRCVRTFFGHLEGVWGLAADTLRVLSGAQDGMVKVWDPRTGKCERTFTGHSGPVTCVGLSDSRMVTGSEDCEVRIYSFKCDEAPPDSSEGWS